MVHVLAGWGVRGDLAAAGGWKVHSRGDVPLVVTVCLWTAGGRVLDRCESPFPGNPRCCCVRVCQSPVLAGALAGGAPVPIRWGCHCRRWPRLKVMYERVAGIDVHKDMVKVAIRSPGDKPWTRTTEILEFRTFYGVLQHMAAELRKRGVTHVYTGRSCTGGSRRSGDLVSAPPLSAGSA